MTKNLPAYAVFANSELQIISTTAAQARKEMKDLRKMDCDAVKCWLIEGGENEGAADAINDAMTFSGNVGPKKLQAIADFFKVTIKKF